MKYTKPEVILSATAVNAVRSIPPGSKMTPLVSDSKTQDTLATNAAYQADE